MIYPKKKPSTAGDDTSSKKIINREQREALKKMISEKYQNQYPQKEFKNIFEKYDVHWGCLNNPSFVLKIRLLLMDSEMFQDYFDFVARKNIGHYPHNKIRLIFNHVYV